MTFPLKAKVIPLKVSAIPLKVAAIPLKAAALPLKETLNDLYQYALHKRFLIEPRGSRRGIWVERKREMDIGTERKRDHLKERSTLYIERHRSQ